MKTTFKAQRGATLLVALIMLVVLTLLVVSAMRASMINLRIAGNMQMQSEAAAASQQAIEQLLSTNFTASPVAQTINVDINNDGVTDYIVSVAAPSCTDTTAVLNNDPIFANNPSNPCLSSGVATNTGIMSSSGSTLGASQSWCYKQNWEIQATVNESKTGAAASTHQGVYLLVPAGTTC